MFCLLPVVLIAAPNNRWRSFFFHFQEAERRTGGHPKIALDPLCLKDATLFILTSKLGFERFCSPQQWLRLVDFWLCALERCRRSCTPSTSGTRLKVKKPGSDPQRNCLDLRAHQVWWINSVRKKAGNIFEGWCFFLLCFHLLLAPLVEDKAKTHPMH